MEQRVYDLVIVGAGAAGLMAAKTAAEKGVKRIALLEKGSRPGGNGGNFASTAFSTAFSDRGSYENDENADILTRRVIGDLHYMGNAGLIRNYVHRTKDVARYFEGKVEWTYLQFRRGNTPAGSYNVASSTAMSLSAQFRRVLEAELECYKDTVSVFTKTRAVKLLTAEDGARVCGVIAEQDGKETEFLAKNVILSCGGYAGSMQAVAKYLSWCEETDMIRLRGVPTNTGDGIEMCERIGIETRKQMNIHMLPPWFAGYEYSRFGSILVSPRVLKISAAGRRLMDESAPFSYMAELSRVCPGKVVYGILDTPAMKKIWEETKTPDVDLNDPRIRRLGDLMKFDTPFEDMETVFAKYIRSGDLIVAGSIGEAAAAIGAVPEVLECTVRDYNQAVHKREDSMMFKDARYLTDSIETGPFYLLRGKCSVDSTQGGITVDADLRPLKPNGMPVDGIYICGDHVTGFAAEHYYSPAGAGLTFALTSGMIAAEQAAAAVS